MSEGEDPERYVVVINHEEQYAIWPSGREVPAGWDPVGEPRSKAHCLEYIDEHWTDMRPLSVRAAHDRGSD